jgi:xanthine dehydrogenase small subunit
MSEPIRLLLNGERVDVAGLPPPTTRQELLRDERRRTGTKEGCAEGDCGACTVVIAERRADRICWKPINACIRLLPSLDGKAVFTVESLKTPHGELHPVQQALVECHGSQCGFCTPGFAMSLFALYKTAAAPTRADIDDALSGNLCRCTGYRSIIDAANRMYALPDADGWRGRGTVAGSPSPVADAELGRRLDAMARSEALEYDDGGQRWSAPRTASALATAYAARPQARLVSGMTDVALAVTKQRQLLGDLLYVADVDELAFVRETATGIDIGAAATLTDAVAVLNRTWPELAEAWQRFASVPIRNSATLVGNVANGSPIGDSMPILIALDATLTLRRGATTRSVAVDAFYPGFRRTALQPGEFMSAVHVPARETGTTLRAYKVSKRYDQDISAVFACFALALDGADRITRARIGCGGVAATPARAARTERALEGSRWTAETAERAASTLASEFSPIDDLRASAHYRRRILGNLVIRCFHETRGAADAPLRVESPLVAGVAR